MSRLGRDTAVACLALALVAGAWSRDVSVVGGVLGGGMLIGLAIWAVAGFVDGLLGGGPGGVEGGQGGSQEGGTGRVSAAFMLVKFFTRHAILAVVAYVMMVRLHLDPVGMVVGVTSVVVAAIVEAARPQ